MSFNAPPGGSDDDGDQTLDEILPGSHIHDPVRTDATVTIETSSPLQPTLKVPLRGTVS